MRRDGRRNRKGAHGLQWRGQSVPEEWANAKDCRELLERGQVAQAVSQRTGGVCYIEGCRGGIIAYPHAIPRTWEGVHHPVNRVGVCGVHSEAMRAGRDPHGEIRQALRLWLIAWYADRGIGPDWWRAMATGSEPITAEVADRDRLPVPARGCQLALPQPR